MNAKTLALVAGAALAGALAASWLLRPAPPPAAPVAPPAPAASAPAASPPASAPAAQAGPLYPVPAPDQEPPLAAAGIADALVELLGSKAVGGFLQTDDFPRRVAATVDNLGRAHAPAALWPVYPTPGRFTVAETPSGPQTAVENAARYTPLVLLAETIDARKAAQLYARMYPQLQQAYRQLGYPQGHFNDRVVEVIDQLLATPEVEYPLALRLLEIKGPYASERPWVRYQFADPALERLSAGQKILLRVGPVNQRRLKHRLADLREQLVAGAQAAPAAPGAPGTR